MPSLAQLQAAYKPSIRKPNKLLDRNRGEETLVIDERSRRSCAYLVEEKLSRLIRQPSASLLTVRLYDS